MTKIVLGHIDGETAKLLAEKRGVDVRTLVVNLLHAEASFRYFMERPLPPEPLRKRREKAKAPQPEVSQ